ncbi:hypothetical protein AVEN_139226-1 [Araneus ventricosus]|uniref:Uncharacterized protein n=1 Tax=Araneus ventricosus TaxID=182803 RepID=A0A4Y2G380_ARAVE|nr:hypothetical protein AVEN_139226-1 [Araneus ventricosus]
MKEELRYDSPMRSKKCLVCGFNAKPMNVKGIKWCVEAENSSSALSLRRRGRNKFPISSSRKWKRFEVEVDHGFIRKSSLNSLRWCGNRWILYRELLLEATLR